MMKDGDLLLATLSRVLDIEPLQIDDDTDLLGLGLDSMGTMRVASHLRRAGVPVKFSMLIGKRTLGEWRRELSGSAKATGTAAVAEPPVGTDNFDLATMQHAFWIGRGEDQQFGGVAAHFYAELDGRVLDPGRLGTAVGLLVGRHPMLRLRVTPDSRQSVLPQPGHPVFRVHDLRELDEAAAVRELERLRDRHSHQQLRVEKGEVLMVALSLLPSGRSRLHIDLDMIAGDAVSLRIILRELALLYRRPEAALPPPGISYRDHLRERTASRAADRILDAAWWQERLDGLATAPALPLRGARDVDVPARVARHHHWLDAKASRCLRRLCQQNGVTPAAALAALFAETVGLWSGGSPFLLNLPVFSRQSEHPDIDAVIGDFSSSVLVNATPGAGSFAAQAAALQDRLHEAIAHSAYGGVEVLRDLTRREQGRQILAPVVFTSALGLGDLYEADVREQFGEPAWSISQGPQVWLDGQVTDYGGGVLVNWDVRDDAFIEGTVPAMFAYFRFQLERLLREPEYWREPLEAPPPVVPLKPRRVVPHSEPEPLIERFFAHAERTPHAMALVWGEEGQLSYTDLARQALCVAGHLAEQGAQPGDAVAITMEKGPPQIAAVLGVLAAGCSYVPCGIDTPPLRRAHIYRIAGVRLALMGEDGHGPEGVTVLRMRTALDAAPARPVPVPARQVMYVIFTSGSTGAPKGVEVSHRAVANTVDAVNRRFGIGARDRTLTLSELDFDLSAYDIFAFLANGGSAAVVAEGERRDARAWLGLIRRWRVNVISCVPALLDMLLTAAGSERLPELRLVMLGGDRILPDLAQRWWRAAKDATFVGLGGMTEAAIHSTVYPLSREDSGWTVVPYGRPLDNMACRVVDLHGRDCPAWVAGELWVGGPAVAIGYRGDPDRTAGRFVMHAGQRWYRSGDQVRYRPDGVIEFLGRIDNQVKIRGHRIELGEVEAVLSTHPAVEQALVVVVALATRQLCALVALRQACDPGELRQWMAARLPRYAVPEHVQVLQHFPLTPNGKLDRKALTQEAERALRDESAPLLDGTAQGRAAQGEVEQVVSECWHRLLAVPEVGRQDNFFVLGGDSLLATRLMAELQWRGLIGRLSDLFAKPELAAFCATLHHRADVAQPVIAPDPSRRFEPFALTDIQRAFWIGRSPQMLLGGTGSHFYVEFDGEGFDIPRLEATWRSLVARHDMLRAIVTADGRQQVLETVPAYGFVSHALAAPVAGAGLAAIRDELSHACYDPTRWPLFGIHAAEYLAGGGRRQRLFVSLDSMMLDGRSIMLLFTEWDLLYRDPGAVLPPLALQFRDYVEQYGSGAAAVAAARAYWQNRIVTLPDAPALPLRTSPEMVRHPRFRRLSATLDPGTWERFRQRAQAHGVTPSVALAAAYGEVLGYWSNQAELAVNLTVFDRPRCHPAIDQVVGDFASILLLGYQVAGTSSFAEAADRLQRQEGEGLSHRDVSGVWVLRELARHRGEAMATMPVVFTSVLGLPQDASMDLSPAFPRQVYACTQTPQVWLDAKVSDSAAGLALDWDALEELFPLGMVDEMFVAYRALVTDLAGRDWTLPPGLLLPDAQRRVRETANDSDHAWTDRRPLYMRVFDQARLTPLSPALHWAEDGGMDYATLARQALHVAGHLAALGVVPGDRVAVTHVKGPGQVVAVLGVLAAGGCYVPSGIDLPVARRRDVYASAGATLVLTDDESCHRLDWPDAVRVISLSEALGGPTLAVPVRQPLEALKYIIFTSGSTGTPKGVAVSHGAVANTVDAVARTFGVDAGDRTIALSALDFDLSAYDLFAFLSLGASVVVVPEEHRRDAAVWVALINRWQVSVVSAVPALAEMIGIAADGPGLPASLRLVMVGGDRVARALPNMLWRHAPRIRFVALGGMTEAAIHSTCHEVLAGDPAWACAPYGRPLPNMRCRVVDAHGRDCPDWVKGELWVAGSGVAQGYHGDAERTREKFVLWEGRRWYRTGDVARYAAGGVLDFLGRADSQVKVRGHRIELAELESALVAHPHIEAATAVLLTGATAKLGAAVIAAAPLDLPRIRDSLREVLPDYEVPEYLVQLNRFPLTPNGKIDRKAIAARLATAAGAQQQSGPPVGPAEEAVAALWSELLGVQGVDTGDDFFALGGDSLVATRLMSRLQALGYRGALASLFTHPGLRAFTATLEAGGTVAAVVLQPDEAHRHEPFPLTDVQQAYWLGRREDFELGGIAAQCYVEYDFPGLDPARLGAAWAVLTARHDMLRCVVGEDGMQRVLARTPAGPIAVHDLRGQGAEALPALRDELSRRMLSTATGPLVAPCVIRHGEDRTRLAVVFDNLVVDGLSMLILLSELFQLCDDPVCELPPVGIGFRDYVLARVRQGVPGRALDYWRGRLADLPPAPALPVCVDPATLQRPRFSRLEARLSPERWAQLTARARDAGITPSVLLLTCFGEVLSRWSGQAELVMNLTLFDRKEVHPDINRVVGDFTSLVLAAYRAAPGESWLDRASRMQAQIWRDLDHQDVSAVQVLRELASRSGAEARAVPVVFTSMLGVADTLAKSTRWPDVTRSQTPQVWLDHQAIDLENGLLLSWDHVEGLFPDGMVAAMFRSYQELLEALINGDWCEPLQRALPPSQRHVRDRANDTAVAVAEGDATLHGAFFRRAAEAPDRRALVAPDGGEVGYGALAGQALRVAARLLREGVLPGDRVGICCTRGVAQVAAVFGVLAAGAAYVPVNPAHPPHRQTLMCRKAGVRVVLSDHAPRLDDVTLCPLGEALAASPLTAPVPVAADALAYVIFTSGSTGEPKGVEVEHRSALNTVDDICQRFAVVGPDVALGVSALDFDLSVFDLFGPLGRGATLVLIGDDEQRDAERWTQLLAREGVTLWNSVPALLEMVLAVAPARGVTLPSLRLALLSGDWVTPDTGARLARVAPQARLIVLGGATEASIWSNWWEVGPRPLEGWNSVPYGLPLGNQSFRVVGPLGEDVPDWVTGELWIGGQGVAHGYAGDPGQTKARFGGDRLRRWYRTGDMGRYRPNGLLEFLGRRDGQVKLRGHRIELGEVEQVLAQHPAVRQAVALLDGTGEGATLLAFALAGPGSTDGKAEVSSLREFLRERLAPYAVPAEVVPLAAWPLNANGKVDRHRLLELRPRAEPQAQSVTGATALAVAGIWHELLGIAPGSDRESFFALGGNSLQAARLVARLSERFGVAVLLRDFFADATLAGVVAAVDGQLADRLHMEEDAL